MFFPTELARYTFKTSFKKNIFSKIRCSTHQILSMFWLSLRYISIIFRVLVALKWVKCVKYEKIAKYIEA